MATVELNARLQQQHSSPDPAYALAYIASQLQEHMIRLYSNGVICPATTGLHPDLSRHQLNMACTPDTSTLVDGRCTAMTISCRNIDQL
jgi:hypothetical protein